MMETELESQKQKQKQKKIMLVRDKHIITITNTKLNKSLRYDLIKMQMEKFYEKEKRWKPVSHQYPFFESCYISDIGCEEKKFMDMIYKTRELNPNCSSVSTFIARMKDALVYENYIAENIKTECKTSHGWGNRIEKDVLKNPLEFYSRNIIKFFKKFDITVTLRLEALFINYYKVMEILINEIMNSDCNVNDLKTFFEQAQYSFDDFKTLIIDFKYDLKALMEYCIGYAKPFENLEPRDSLNLLRDYYSMGNKIGRDVKKYPKYLRSMHDIINANYNDFKRHYDLVLFEKLIKSDLEFEGKDFCVIVPKNPKELISEGTSNNNCVGSYIDRILKCETYLMFMRKTDNKEMSLITLELRNGRLVQYKGSYNRNPDDKEMDFIKLYCKQKNIKLEGG